MFFQKTRYCTLCSWCFWAHVSLWRLHLSWCISFLIYPPLPKPSFQVSTFFNYFLILYVLFFHVRGMNHKNPYDLLISFFFSSWFTINISSLRRVMSCNLIAHLENGFRTQKTWLYYRLYLNKKESCSRLNLLSSLHDVQLVKDVRYNVYIIKKAFVGGESDSPHWLLDRRHV